jgi:hypothetical protein
MLASLTVVRATADGLRTEDAIRPELDGERAGAGGTGGWSDGQGAPPTPSAGVGVDASDGACAATVDEVFRAGEVVGSLRDEKGH